MSDVLAVIPARGGSTELKRKNLLPIGGTPMFLRSARAARDAGCQVIVSTDDPEIRSTAIVAGFEVCDQTPSTADQVAKDASEDWEGSVLLVQPTVQPITAGLLRSFLEDCSTVQTTMVHPFTHQLFDGHHILTERVNRQDLVNDLNIEIGIRWWPSSDHIGYVPGFVKVEAFPLVDIDTAADYRSVTIPKQIALWPIADETHGMGHLRRCLAIAERLQHHDIVWITDDMDIASEGLLDSRGWDLLLNHGWGSESAMDGVPDLWILDRLDNENIPHLLGNVITLEDISNYQADVKIDALYTDGADWCVLRPEFLAGDYKVRDEPLYAPRLLVLFGGTDPTGLGKIVTSLFPNHPLDWIQAGDDRAVAEAMHQADILITSAGRTVFEAAAVGIPTIVLAQNLRETTHTHLGYEHGNIYLGLGRLVSDKVIVDTVRTLGEDVTLRRELSERGRPDGLGMDRIVHKIEGLLRGL